MSNRISQARFDWIMKNIPFYCWLVDMKVPTGLIVEISNSMFLAGRLNYDCHDGID
ncbi:MAG: hypothetical protein PHX34_05185 [Candidatus Shapirobacteria bacterium]|nr:hypothetical protein [Candidatus Shapirobacteria bacterium]